jgi:5-(carboxyamino)imidazole ribonucleotide mutase
MDSLLSIVQMPAGVPVATVSIAGARNAGLLAVRILAAGTDDLAVRLRAELLEFAQELNDVASRKGANLRQKVNEVFSDNNVGLRGSR